MKNYIKAPVLVVAVVFAASGCNLLDVDNPNNLVEDLAVRPAAANSMTNGSLQMVSEAIADLWEGPAVVADELYWTGSRDAWGQLDNGYISDPLNEFTDDAFPSLGRAVWMAQRAVDLMAQHVAEDPDDGGLARDYARAQLYNGIVLMVTGELQEDMTFSDKMESGQPVGPMNMSSVLDDAIANLDGAVTGFNELGEDDLELRARAVRARAHMSRAIWEQLNPTATVGGALDFTAALADANAVLDEVGGSDWQYALEYSNDSNGADMLGNVNERGENQIDDSLVENDGPGASGRTGVVALLDPVSAAPDTAVAKWVAQFGSDEFGELTIVSERLLRLIVAEHDLATGPTAEFEAQIDAIRDLDDKADFNSGGAVSDLEILQHERRVNTLFMGLRLQDMYRWGIQDARWQSASSAVTAPGTMLPITVIECRANEYLDSNCQTLSGG